MLAEERPARQGGREAARRRARSELVLVEQRSRGSRRRRPEIVPRGAATAREQRRWPRDRSSWSKNRLEPQIHATAARRLPKPGTPASAGVPGRRCLASAHSNHTSSRLKATAAPIARAAIVTPHATGVAIEASWPVAVARATAAREPRANGGRCAWPSVRPPWSARSRADAGVAAFLRPHVPGRRGAEPVSTQTVGADRRSRAGRRIPSG